MKKEGLNMNEKGAEYGSKLYRRIADVVSEEIMRDESSPAFTIRAIALCMVRVTIAIVGYEKANAVMVGAINEAMEQYKQQFPRGLI